jgi:hypothetical protein
MSAPNPHSAQHRVWRAAYRVLLALMPRELRVRHGEAMVDLYARELSRRAPDGGLATMAAALAGLGDLLGRGLQERMADERRHFGVPERRVLWQSVKGFALAFFVLTDAMLALGMSRQYKALTGDQMLSVLWYSVPYVAALTIPMALFVAVLAALNNRNDMTGDDANRKPTRALPLLALGVVATVLAFGVVTKVVPEANTRLMAVRSGRSDLPRGDRNMTLNELRARSNELTTQLATGKTQRPAVDTREAINAYRVEYHKKFAIPAACFVFTLFAVSLTRRLRRIRLTWQMVVSLAVFTGYYMLLMGGEALADSGRLAPSLAMWGANLTLLLLTLGLRTRAHRPVTG